MGLRRHIELWLDKVQRYNIIRRLLRQNIFELGLKGFLNLLEDLDPVQHPLVLTGLVHLDAVSVITN